ncbi:MAG: hypothetical protein Q8R30_04720 [bacterium]|nr:hypothetical protein [bacterium]
MFGQATLMVHRGAKLVSREELNTIEPPPATDTWKPVKHAHVIDMIHQEMELREIEVVKEEYAIQRDGNYLFAAMVLNWLKTDDFAAALAFRHSNDRKESMKMYAGMNVFACDNMALSGDEIILHKRHLPSLNVRHELMKAFDRYQSGALILSRNIEDLKNETLTPADAERKLFTIFHRRILPARLLVPVADSYFDGDTPTTWALLNACTFFTKELQPGPNLKASVGLGKFFGLGKNGHQNGAANG